MSRFVLVCLLNILVQAPVQADNLVKKVVISPIWNVSKSAINLSRKYGGMAWDGARFTLYEAESNVEILIDEVAEDLKKVGKKVKAVGAKIDGWVNE